MCNKPLGADMDSRAPYNDNKYSSSDFEIRVNDEIDSNDQLFVDFVWELISGDEKILAQVARYLSSHNNVRQEYFNHRIKEL